MDRVCHFEVPYADKSRMESFYSDVFGWNFQAAPGDMPYTFIFTTDVDETMMPKAAGGINGGSYPRGDEGGSKNPVIVIEVASRLGMPSTSLGSESHLSKRLTPFT